MNLSARRIGYRTALSLLAGACLTAACSESKSSPDATSPAGSAGAGAAGASGGAGSGNAGAAGTNAVAPIDPSCLKAIDQPSDFPAGDIEAGPSPEIDCGTPTFPDGTGLRRAPYLQAISHTKARVMWTTTTGGDGVLQVGPSKRGPWTDVAATAEFFDTARTSDTESYTSYDARLSALKPNSGYCYRVVEDTTVIASGLKLNTAWKGDSRPLQILAFGDSGNGSPEQAAVRDEFMKRKFDVFLHLGDMAYGSGTFTEFEAHVFDVYRDFMHRVPSFPVIGNHEFEKGRGEPYWDVYSLWEVALDDWDQERYYSFDYGNAHFVALDTNDLTLVRLALNHTNPCDMIDWLRHDLASSDAEWKIAFFHHPPYTSSDRGTNARVVAQILPALEEFGVDLVLVGHDHHYERIAKMKGGKMDENGIRYVIVGNGGAGVRELDDPPQPFSEVTNDQKQGFLSVTIDGCDLNAEAIDLAGNVIDTWAMKGCQ